MTYQQFVGKTVGIAVPTDGDTNNDRLQIARREEGSTRSPRVLNVTDSNAVTSRQVTHADADAEKKKIPPTPKGAEIGFFEFWNQYPRKTAKDSALKAWMKLKPDAELRATIARAVETQTQWPQWTKDGGEYIPHAATWLNKKRWQDEAPNAAATISGDYQRLMTDVTAGAV